MQWYWRLQSIPELQDLTPAERRMAWRACAWRVVGHWQVWVILVLYVLIVDIGGSFIHEVLLWFGVAALPAWWSAASYWLAGGVNGVIVWQVMTHYIRPYLRAFRTYQQRTGEWAPDGTWVDLVE